MSQIRSKIAEDLNLSQGNDVFLHDNIHTKKPEKYVNKTRNLKPFSHDYRNLLSKTPQLNSKIFINGQPEYVDNIKTNPNQQPKNQSSLWNKLKTQGDDPENDYENNNNKQFQPNKSVNYGGEYNDNNGYMQGGFSGENDDENGNSFINNLNLKIQLNNKDLECYHMDKNNQNYSNVDQINHFNGDDLQIIKTVQGVLKKKEQNHNHIYRMLSQQKDVIGKLLQKYKKQSLQEEKILAQKMRELEQQKNNYLNMKQNEDMLKNLQNQLSIRLKDYKANQKSMHEDNTTTAYIAGLYSKNDGNISSHQKYQNQIQISEKQAMDQIAQMMGVKEVPKNCEKHRCRQARSVHSNNQTRWQDYTYNSNIQQQQQQYVRGGSQKRVNRRPTSSSSTSYYTLKKQIGKKPDFVI